MSSTTTVAGISASLSVVSQSEGGNSILLTNIVIGDVYICSGQSNMEWPLAASNNAQEEIASANFLTFDC